MNPEILESEALNDNNNAGRFDDIPLEEWEQGAILDTVGSHDASYTVTAFWDGCDISGVGHYSCGELQNVEEIEAD